MGKTVVILGAGVAGLPIAHHLLKHTAPLVIGGLKVVLVSPNTDFFWNFAAPRGILPDNFSDDKIFLPIARAFAKYPQDQFELIVGKAEALDPEKSSVRISVAGSQGRSLSYDTLVIATGSSAKDGMPFKELGSTEETKDALHRWQERIRDARTIVVAGAGLTGVELAGELGSDFSSSGKKEITLIADKELPLAEPVKRAVRQTVQVELEKLGVRVLSGTKVTKVTDAGPGGQKVVEVTNSATGETQSIPADAFIPAYGIKPNTSFLPKRMLDPNGFVKQTSYLQVEGYKNIFVVGDAGNLQPPQAVATDNQTQHVVKSLKAQLTGQDTAIEEYKFEKKVMFGVTLGKSRGTGQLGNFQPWSFMIWYLKGRYMGTDHASQFVAGSRTMQAKKWA